MLRLFRTRLSPPFSTQENLVCVFERYTLNQHLEAIHFTEHGMDGNIDFAGA